MHYFIDDQEKLETFLISGNIADDYLELYSSKNLFSSTHFDEFSKILVEVFIANEKNANNILDLGCGYGVVGIALQRYYHSQVTFSDINAKAVAVTKLNLEKYNLKSRVIKSDGLKTHQQLYSYILLNPPIHASKQKCFELIFESVQHLQIDGCLYLVVHKKHGARSYEKYLQELFPKTYILYKKSGLFVFKCKLS